MTISNVGGPTAPKAPEPKGPDIKNDHDGDDAPVAAPAAKGAPPAGQGTMIDTNA